MFGLRNVWPLKPLAYDSVGTQWAASLRPAALAKAHRNEVDAAGMLRASYVDLIALDYAHGVVKRVCNVCELLLYASPVCGNVHLRNSLSGRLCAK